MKDTKKAPVKYQREKPTHMRVLISYMKQLLNKFYLAYKRGTFGQFLNYIYEQSKSDTILGTSILKLGYNTVKYIADAYYSDNEDKLRLDVYEPYNTRPNVNIQNNRGFYHANNMKWMTMYFSGGGAGAVGGVGTASISLSLVLPGTDLVNRVSKRIVIKEISICLGCKFDAVTTDQNAICLALIVDRQSNATFAPFYTDVFDGAHVWGLRKYQNSPRFKVLKIWRFFYVPSYPPQRTVQYNTMEYYNKSHIVSTFEDGPSTAKDNSIWLVTFSENDVCHIYGQTRIKFIDS